MRLWAMTITIFGTQTRPFLGKVSVGGLLVRGAFQARWKGCLETQCSALQPLGVVEWRVSLWPFTERPGGAPSGALQLVCL